MAIIYEDEIRAGRAAEEVDRCALELLIDSDATSVAICERDGSVSLTTSRRPEATAPWSRFWSVLLDAVMSEGGAEDELFDGGEFAAQLRVSLVPGSSVLLLVVARCREAAVLDVLSPLEGSRLVCVLADDLPRRWGIADLRFDG